MSDPDADPGTPPLFRHVGRPQPNDGGGRHDHALRDHDTHVAASAWRWFGTHPGDLPAAEARVLRHAAERRVVSRSPEGENEPLTFGEGLADRVARLGGSWGFIVGFGASLAAWAALNSLALARPFDPYPYIFLNLMLSMLAAIQAPIIMMSQNRQAAKDRATAARDYEVNLKAEIEIMGLHDKLDRLRDQHLAEMLAKQREQIDLLTTIVAQSSNAARRHELPA